MKKLVFCLLLAYQPLFAQTILHSDTVAVYQEEENTPFLKSIRVPFGFNESEIKESIPDSIRDLTIERIDLIYSTFKKNPQFDQVALNKSRKEKLERVWTLASNPLIEWNSVGQNGAIELKTAKQLFHGFVIYYRPKPTKESIEEELSMIDEYLKSSPRREAA